MRVVEKVGGRDWRNDEIQSVGMPGERNGKNGNKRGRPSTSLNSIQQAQTFGWKPSCSCDTEETVRPIVLDPFMGSGTVGLVAKKLNRDYIGIELNQEYIEMAEKRIREKMGLFVRSSV